jgi:tetratricopeptide (TPR) repeat protein
MASQLDILQNAFSRMMMENLGQRRSRQSLIAEYDRRLDEIDRKHSKATFNFNTTNNKGYKGISQNVKLMAKNRISLADLELDKVHSGKFLLCRVIRKCIKMTALATVVEDPEGDVERLSLYNWVQQSAIPAKDRGKTFTTSKFLPIGTILVIKNPYYKVAADYDNTLRSDNPSDVIVLDSNHKLLSDIKWSTDSPGRKKISERSFVDKKVLSTDDFRLRGNDYFASSNFAAAVDEYSSGIKLEPNNVTLLANRAEAYLRLNQFGKALDDVEIILKHDHNHLKAAYRKGKALCGLKRYQEAVTVLQDLDQRMKLFTDSGHASIKNSTEQMLKHAEVLDSESRNGQYDFIRIVDEFREKAKTKGSDLLGNSDWVCETGPRLDHADFLIDDIEIRSVKKKGKGWVAKRDIPEHTLLMVSKAYKVVFSNETPISFSIDWSSKTMDSATQSELITCIAQKLMAEPDTYQEVYKLYGGPDLISGEKLNEDSMCSVDVNKIEKIIKYNSFEPVHRWKIFEKDSPFTKDFGTGLWILPSYFNHSCIDTNVIQSFLGDLMFLRSSRPILKGEELTLTYCDPMKTFEDRTKHLNPYDINCQCRLCKLDRSDKQKTKLQRASIIETFEEFIRPRVFAASAYNKDPSLIKELTEMIAELSDMRKEHPELEFQAFRLKTALALVYAKNEKPRQSISVLKEVYDFLKTTKMPLITNDVAFQISLRYCELRQIEEAKKWFDITLKDSVEPLRGKFKDEETKWKDEALHLMEKLLPEMFTAAKNYGLFNFPQ